MCISCWLPKLGHRALALRLRLLLCIRLVCTRTCCAVLDTRCSVICISCVLFQEGCLACSPVASFLFLLLYLHRAGLLARSADWWLLPCSSFRVTMLYTSFFPRCFCFFSCFPEGSLSFCLETSVRCEPFWNASPPFAVPSLQSSPCILLTIFLLSSFAMLSILFVRADTNPLSQAGGQACLNSAALQHVKQVEYYKSSWTLGKCESVKRNTT
jgi:hypothetical protein